MRPPTASKKEMMTKFDAEGFLKICGENQGISNPWTLNYNNLYLRQTANLYHVTNLILLTCALLFINSTPKLVASC